MRTRHTLEELLAQCDPSAPRSEDERAWLDAPPVGREFGAVRYLSGSRFRREFTSILRRAECVAIVRQGEVIARLEPVVTSRA